jgi:hypothetical protein
MPAPHQSTFPLFGLWQGDARAERHGLRPVGCICGLGRTLEGEGESFRSHLNKIAALHFELVRLASTLAVFTETDGPQGWIRG